MNKNYGIFGAAVQAARGTAVATPLMSFYASGDSEGISATQNTDALSLTKGGRSTEVSRSITSVDSKAAVTTVGFADSLGLFLFGAMGADTVTGAAAPYTHDIKAGSALPYLTFLQQVGATDAAVQQLRDAKVDEIKMSCEGTKPLSYDLSLIGTEASWLDAVAWAGPACDIDAGYFTVADATVLFSLASASPAAVPAGVVLSKCEIDVSNSSEAVSAMGTVEAADVREKSAKVTVSIEGTSDSTSLYREAITGSASGHSVASSVVRGSLQITLKHTVNADWTFVIKVPAIPWTCDVMSVSTDGGDFDLKLSTDSALDLGSGAVEFILQNAVASYTAA